MEPVTWQMIGSVVIIFIVIVVALHLYESHKFFKRNSRDIVILDLREKIRTLQTTDGEYDYERLIADTASSMGRNSISFPEIGLISESEFDEVVEKYRLTRQRYLRETVLFATVEPTGFD